jgi:hypothetical protein
MPFSLSVATATGVVFWGLVAIAIAAAAKRYRSKLTPLLRHLLLRLPSRFIPLVRRLAYFVYPTWRSFATGSGRTRNGITNRISYLSDSRLPTVLIGGIYLDISLGPVDIKETKNTEYYDLDTVKVAPGGSAFFVGKHIWDAFHRPSYLVSRIGKGDQFSKQLAALLKEVPWIRGNHLSASNNSQCGISVHLIDRDESFRPTFTHKGALIELSWRSIIKEVQHLTRHGGGVVYISGFFRTGLNVDLTTSINQLSPYVLTIVDHGRFQPGDNPAAERSLLEAFRSNAIDVYVCTFDEMLCLAESAGISHPHQISKLELIQSLASGRFLPKVTIIRGEPGPGRPHATLVVDDRIESIQEGPDEWHLTNVPGRGSAFTAGFINYLSKVNPQYDLWDQLVAGVRAGLTFWATHER